jgi:hypothetical protein
MIYFSMVNGSRMRLVARSQGMHQESAWWVLAMVGLLAYACALIMYAEADYDIWAKLALGGWLWWQHALPAHDPFAFTPTLPRYVDHEWGAGLVFYAVLRMFGPAGLMWSKIVIGCAVPAIGIYWARHMRIAWPAVLAVVSLAAWGFLPAFMPVIRSQVFTILFFTIFLISLERRNRGARWPLFVLPMLMLAWANLHGGFIMGLIAVAVCLAFSSFGQTEEGERASRRSWIYLLAGCVAATVANPWGVRFWPVIAKALFKPRPQIIEWLPLPLWADDPFIGFRILFAVTLILIALNRPWRQPRVWPGLVILLLTAAMAWRSRRHASIFGAAALVYLPAILSVTVERFTGTVRRHYFWPNISSRTVYWSCALFFFGLCAFALSHWLPAGALRPLTSSDRFPVHACELLRRAGARGNIVTHFQWGSYVAWRLYPSCKISMDGRYEAVYPESTFQMSQDFFQKDGADWDRLLVLYRVDYILMANDYTNVSGHDLIMRGFRLVESREGTQLYARRGLAEWLARAALSMPLMPSEPLDYHIPAHWGSAQSRQR